MGNYFWSSKLVEYTRMKGFFDGNVFAEIKSNAEAFNNAFNQLTMQKKKISAQCQHQMDFKTAGPKSIIFKMKFQLKNPFALCLLVPYVWSFDTLLF